MTLKEWKGETVHSRLLVAFRNQDELCLLKSEFECRQFYWLRFCVLLRANFFVVHVEPGRVGVLAVRSELQKCWRGETKGVTKKEKLFPAEW
jgi:hypothetical protein